MHIFSGHTVRTVTNSKFALYWLPGHHDMAVAQYLIIYSIFSPVYCTVERGYILVHLDSTKSSVNLFASLELNA